MPFEPLRSNKEITPKLCVPSQLYTLCEFAVAQLKVLSLSLSISGSHARVTNHARNAARQVLSVFAIGATACRYAYYILHIARSVAGGREADMWKGRELSSSYARAATPDNNKGRGIYSAEIVRASGSD